MTPQLSPFQKKLCKLRTQGLTGKEIADLTGLSYVNVRKKFWEIRKILGLDKESNLLLFSQAAENKTPFDLDKPPRL
jgi:hypothetical protein